MARPSLGAAEWAALIDQWRESGMSLPAFCQAHGLRRGTMQNWVYKPAMKLAVEDARRASPESRGAPTVPTGRPTAPAFLPVRLAEIDSGSRGPQSRPAIEVVLGQGRRIGVAPGFDAETLRRVVAVLEG